MTDNEVRELDLNEYGIWDELVNASQQGTIFHTSDWITECARLRNNKAIFLGKFVDENLVGGLSVFFNEKMPMTKYAFSNDALMQYGGFILRNSESTQVRKREQLVFSICNSVLEKLGQMKFDGIEIVNSPYFGDIRPLTWKGWIPSIYFTYILHIINNIETIISKDVKWTVKKAKKQDISIRRTYKPELFWNLIVDTYSKQGLAPPFSKGYLNHLMDLLIEKKRGEMWIAETSSGEPASIEFIALDDHMAHRWSAASNLKYKNTGATSLLLFEIFNYLQERGFSKINLMAGNMPHLAMFISGFNPSLVPYFGVKKLSYKYHILRQSVTLLNAMR